MPDAAKCGWPPFLRPYNSGNSGTDFYSGTAFLFETRNKFNESYDPNTGVTTLVNSGVYLNLSKMGLNETAIAGAEIHFHDDADRWWWLGKMNQPVRVTVTEFDDANNRPVKWTITSIIGSYPGWDSLPKAELGSPNINKRVSGSWWCAFGHWNMPFELRLARLQ